MSSSPRDPLYLDHIAERIRRIEDAAQRGREAFDSSYVLQDAIIRNFEVIGEAQQCEVVFGLIDRSPDTKFALSGLFVECSKQLLFP